MHIDVEILCCTPETNIILYVDYTSIKKIKKQNVKPKYKIK